MSTNFNCLDLLYNLPGHSTFTAEEAILCQDVLSKYSTKSSFFGRFFSNLNQNDPQVAKCIQLIADKGGFKGVPNEDNRVQRAVLVILEGAIIAEKEKKNCCTGKEKSRLDELAGKVAKIAFEFESKIDFENIELNKDALELYNSLIYHLPEHSSFTSEEADLFCSVLSKYSTKSIYDYHCPVLTIEDAEVRKCVQLIKDKVLIDKEHAVASPLIERIAYIFLKGSIFAERNKKNYSNENEKNWLNKLELKCAGKFQN